MSWVSALRRIPGNSRRLLSGSIRSIYPVTFLDFGRCYSAAALETLPELEALYLITTQDLLALENAKDFLETAGARGKGADRVQVRRIKRPYVKSSIPTISKSTWACGSPAFSATTPKRSMKHGRKAACWAPIPCWAVS